MVKENKKIKSETKVEEKEEAVKLDWHGQVVNCDKLNIRKEPSLDADILAVVYKGDILEVDASISISGWYAVTTASGCSGFTMAKYVV